MTAYFRALPIVLASLLLSWGGVALSAEQTLKLSAGDPADAPGPQGARKLAELLAAGDSGLSLKVFPAAVLGNDVQMLGALPGGTVEMALVGAPTLVGLVKEFGVLDLPYQFQSAAEVDALLDGPLGEQLLAKLEDQGLVGLGFWEIGFRNVTNSKRPIERWEDLKGLKIRTVQSPIFRAFFDQLGANAQPMPINEVFSALETRAIDAQENPLSLIASQRFNEVQPYLSLTEHIYTAYVLLISRKTWNALDEAQRAALKQAAASARDFQRQLARQTNQDKLTELQGLGMRVNQLSDVERQRFVEQAELLAARQRDAIGAEFVAAWQAELQRLRGGQ